MKRLLRSTATALHARLARTGPWSTAYLELLGSVSRTLPHGAGARVRNSVVLGGPWGPRTLAPRKVRLGQSVEVRMVPHLGEFDAEALFCRALSYERAAFVALEERISEYDVVVEVGANIGVYTLFFEALRARTGRPREIFAFEPSREAFRRLLENLRVNGFGDAVCINAALSGRCGVRALFEPLGHLTNGSLDEGFARSFSEEVRPAWVAALSGAEVAAMLPAPPSKLLLKIDVEGAECEVLDTLAGVVESRRPDILIEVLPALAERIERHPTLRDYRRFEITEGGLVERPRLQATTARDWLCVAAAR